MPSITINEVDYTKSNEIDSSNVVVYIPGLNGTGGTLAANVPTLYTSLDDFTKGVGATPKNFASSGSADYDLSFIEAYELLDNGMQVIYEVVGDNISTRDAMVTALNTSAFWSKLKDRTKYQFRFISNGGYVTSNTSNNKCLEYMEDVASVRGDCVALVDCAKTYSLSSGETVAKKIYDEVNTTSAPSWATSYASMFAPWCTMEVGCVSSNVVMPGAFAYLKAYAKASTTTQPWFAIAGKNRGAISGIVSTVYEFGDIESDVLQKKTGGISINPIINDPTYGYIIWGNRTLNKVVNEGDVKNALSAKDFLNIRQGICSIKKTLYTASRQLTFEQNSNVLWLNFKSKITPLLDRMKNGQGIEDYKITKNTTSERATLNATIRIIPIEAVEYFDLTVELADSLSEVTE